MTLPAARVSDKTTHGGVFSAGAGTVQINGHAALRMSDEHACPIASPWHIGGKVLIGGTGLALTVFIERKPAALAGSVAPCTLGKIPDPNPIAAGSPNVFYTPSHTIAGMPVTMDADGTLRVGNALVIHGGPGYQAEVLADLSKIASTDIGRKKLARLDSSGRTVHIMPAERGNDGKVSTDKGEDAMPVSLGGTGKGADSLLTYTPVHHPPGSKRDTKTDMESDVVLFHELVHAEHNAYGESNPTPRGDKYHNEEELRTITQDENVYRRQRGKPDRPDHEAY